MQFLSSPNFNKSKMVGVVVDPSTTAPVSPVVGQMYYNTSLNYLYYYDGSGWVSVASSSPTSSVLTSTVTTSSVTQTVLLSFAKATYGTAKVVVQATQGALRHTTEILITHDGTTAYATEYGTIYTESKLFSLEVDISSDLVRVLVTSTSAATTAYKSSYILVAG